MNKVVLMVELSEDRTKSKLLKAVSCLPGVDSIAADMKEQKLTVIGHMDPTVVVNKARKLCMAEILTVGPAKEEKKEESDDDKKIVCPINPRPIYYPYYVPATASEENPNSCTVC